MAKKTRFESAARANERDNNGINKSKKMRVYLNSISAAATASKQRMQAMTMDNKANNNQVATLLAALVAKDLQVDKLVAKLTAACVGGGGGGGNRDGTRGGGGNPKASFPRGWKW